MTLHQERLFHVLMQMGRNVKLAISGADLMGRNAAESYVERDGELVGCIKLVKLWHAIGHTVCLMVILYDLSDSFFPQRLQCPPYPVTSSSLDPSFRRPRPRWLR